MLHLAGTSVMLLSTLVAQPHVLQAFFFMKSVAMLQQHVVGGTLEDMEEAEAMKVWLLKKVDMYAEREGKKAISTIALQRAARGNRHASVDDLDSLFADWACIQGGFAPVSRKEFRNVLANANICMSNDTFKKLWRLLAHGSSAEITYNQFRAFLDKTARRATVRPAGILNTMSFSLGSGNGQHSAKNLDRRLTANVSALSRGSSQKHTRLQSRALPP